MQKLHETIKTIEEIDFSLAAKTQKRLDNLTKPQGSLGRLEELARQVVEITGRENPAIKNKVVFTMAGDHGVTEEGVSLYPKEVTAQMVYNFMNGGAGINVLARHVGARVVVIDMGVAEEITGVSSDAKNFKNKKVGAGTKNMARGKAMTRDEAVRSIEAGIEVIEEELPLGLDIAGTGDMGIGNTTPSSAITSVITGEPVEAVTGRGTGLGDEGLSQKIEVIKKAISVNRADSGDALDVLSKLGGFEIGGIAGLILGAASKRIPVVIDGFISGAAALIACSLAPEVKDYMIASHCSAERGHRVILDYLGLKPVLDLDMRLGEGTGAALGINIVEAGIKILAQMATFESASVSKKNEESVVARQGI